MLRNVGSNWLLTAMTIVVTYILMPFTLHRLGADAYGTWMLITSLTGYIGLLVLGVPMASMRFLAHAVGDDDMEEMNRAVGSCVTIYIALGAIALVVGVALYPAFVHGYSISPAIAASAHTAYWLVVLNVAFGFILQLPYSVMAAYDEFVSRNIVSLVSLLLRLVLTLVWLRFRTDLLPLAIIQIGCAAFEFAVMWALVKRWHPGVRLAIRWRDRQTMIGLFTFSVFVLLLQVGTRLSYQTDSLVIGARIGVAQIAYFTVANSLMLYLIEFVRAIGQVVMPMATKLQTQGKTEDLREVFLKWSKIAFSLSLASGVFLVVAGPRFLGWWIGPGYEQPSGDVLRVLMYGALIYLPARGVALPLLMGLGKPARPTIAFLVMGIVNLGISLWLAKPLGIVGVAIGTAGPMVIYALVLIWMACRAVGISMLSYSRYVFARPTIGAVPVVAAVWFSHQTMPPTLPGLLVTGVVLAACFAAVWIAFVYRDDRFVDVRRLFSRLAPVRA